MLEMIAAIALISQDVAPDDGAEYPHIRYSCIHDGLCWHSLDPALALNIAETCTARAQALEALPFTPEVFDQLATYDDYANCLAPLGEMGRDAVEAADTLRPLLESPSHLVRIGAIQVLGMIGDQMSLPRFRESLQSREWNEVLVAAIALGHSGDADDRALVRGVGAAHWSEEVRAAAHRASPGGTQTPGLPPRTTDIEFDPGALLYCRMIGLGPYDQRDDDRAGGFRGISCLSETFEYQSHRISMDTGVTSYTLNLGAGELIVSGSRPEGSFQLEWIAPDNIVYPMIDGFPVGLFAVSPHTILVATGRAHWGGPGLLYRIDAPASGIPVVTRLADLHNDPYWAVQFAPGLYGVRNMIGMFVFDETGIIDMAHCVPGPVSPHAR